MGWRPHREKLGLSAAGYGSLVGVTGQTICNWEQGRNRPDQAARILLAVIQRHPDIVRGAARRVVAR